MPAQVKKESSKFHTCTHAEDPYRKGVLTLAALCKAEKPLGIWPGSNTNSYGHTVEWLLPYKAWPIHSHSAS